jgi:hypothetical protein
MAANDDAQAELLRRFEAATAGAELADLRRLAGNLTSFAAQTPKPAARPEFRRPRRGGVVIYRIRVDLDHAQPPIWRRLDLRSHLPLDVVHQVLQVAFDWTDSHLYRFSLGGHPFDKHSQLFLCPYVEEGEQEDDGGLPASEVRLDETLQEPEDVLHYLYDYGDSWELTLRLEEILPGNRRLPDRNRGRRSARRTTGGLRWPHRRRESGPQYSTTRPVSDSTRCANTESTSSSSTLSIDFATLVPARIWPTEWSR